MTKFCPIKCILNENVSSLATTFNKMALGKIQVLDYIWAFSFKFVSNVLFEHNDYVLVLSCFSLMSQSVIQSVNDFACKTTSCVILCPH